MSHFSHFMDVVSVKISEKYKRPPRIELPYSVHEGPSRAQNVVDNVTYCSQFENNVLSKVRELRNAKETKKNERRHRLQLLEEAKQKKLDAIAAAEAEEKLKQLSVSEVSYPSTEEISEISPDDKADNCDITLMQDQNQENTANILEPNKHEALPVPNAAEVDPNILQPILVQANYPQNSLLDDPDPLLEYKTHSVKAPQYNTVFKHNIETLTYKDFENDTSSPFDNVELKTINDMELLAQVLQSQRDASSSYHNQPQVFDQNYVPMPNCGSQAQIGYTPNSYIEQPMTGSGLMYIPQNYPISNGCYATVDTNCDNMIQMDNSYMPNYQYYVPSNPYTADTNYYQPQQLPVPAETVKYPVNDSTYIPQPQYYYHTPYQYNQPTNYGTEIPQTVATDIESTSQNPIKSRSRSVPDIVKELEEELSSARLRALEKPPNPSPAPKETPPPAQPAASSSKVKERKKSRTVEHLSNPFDILSKSLQDVCKKIHAMGFPLDRVARVSTHVGENDKKIIEGLLMISELMDLGFSEWKVSQALAKHRFNKDKALDELVR